MAFHSGGEKFGEDWAHLIALKSRHWPRPGMDHEQMAAELFQALGRTSLFQDLPIEGYAASPVRIGVPASVVQHFAGAMLACQRGHMAGADNNVEILTAPHSMTVGEFASLHADQLNAN